MTRAVSLGRAALGRLARDPMAMAGLAVVALITFLCVAAPWVSSGDPTVLRPWIGPTPPGSSHPDSLAENILAIGQAAELPERARRAASVVIEAEETIAVSYRLAVRRGTLDIRRGGERVERLDLAQAGRTAEVLGPDGAPTGRAPALLAVAGEPPPDGLFPPGSTVLMLRVAEAADHATYRATIADGVVRSLTRHGEPVSGPVTVRGEQVRRLAIGTASGERDLVRWHPLGTDLGGRDLWARILYGGRISLMVGAVATLVSLLIGVLYGAISGYAGGRTDQAMMAGIDVLYAIPFMFLVILLLVFFGRDIVILFVALGAVQWLTMARIVRGQVLSLANRDFVLAARAIGVGHGRILVRHLIPNCLGPIIVYGSLTVPMVILEESFLAFIGLAVQHQGQNLDSWGALVKYGVDALDYNRGDRTWLLIYPALAMVATLVALNALGDGLRDAFDPRDAAR